MRFLSWLILLVFCVSIATSPLHVGADVQLFVSPLSKVPLESRRTEVQALPSEWERIYSCKGEDRANSVIQTADLGYLLVGYTSSNSSGVDADGWVIKTDSYGNEQWNRTYGGTLADFFYCVVETTDGYAILGTINADPHGHGQYNSLVKIDKYGETQWQKDYGGVGFYLVATGDGGFAITGIAGAYGGGCDVLLVRTDSYGNKQWDRTYGFDDWDYGFCLVQTGDRGFAITGYTGPFDYKGGSYDVLLVKTDSDGNEQWHNTYGGGDTDWGKSIVRTSDGGYAIAGDGSNDVFLMKTDELGNTQWEKTYGQDEVEECGNSLVETYDGGFAIAGRAYPNLCVFRTDSLGDMQWNATYKDEHYLYSEGFSIVGTIDGGYAVAGHTRPAFASYDALLIKIAPERHYALKSLFDVSPVEVGGILGSYFQVTDWKGTPTNGIPVELRTAFGNQEVTSENFMGLDGIVHVFFDLTNYAGDDFDIYFPDQTFEGMIIIPPSPNPITHSLEPRNSELGFGTTLSCSAAVGLEVGGSYGQSFSVKNDGVNILSFDSLDEAEMFAGVEVTPADLKLGLIQLSPGSIAAEAGIRGGVGYNLPSPGQITQKKLMKNLITRWILTNLATVFPPSLIAKSIIDWENKKLGIDDYGSIVECGAWAKGSVEMGLKVGMQSKHGSATGLGPFLHEGVSGEAELKLGLNVYPNAVGFESEADFSVSVGAGVALNLGFLSAESNVRLDSWGSLGAELVLVDYQISSIELDFQLGVAANINPVLTFSGLAKPLNSLSFSPDQTKARVVHLHYSIPADKITSDLMDYLNGLSYGTIDPSALWNKLVQVVTQTPVMYEIRIEYEDDISIPISVKLPPNIGFEFSWELDRSTTFTCEQGFLYNMQKWPIVQYQTMPVIMDVVSFIKNNWVYDGVSTQPSANLIRLQETQEKLYLHVYDSEGRHVGVDYQTNETDLGIPDVYYFDNLNGTVTVVLPPDVVDFNVTIDARVATHNAETYNLTATTMSSQVFDEKAISAMILSKNHQEYTVSITEQKDVILIPHTQEDINGDRRVNMRDIAYIALRYGIDSSNPLWDAKADVVQDGKIDFRDISTVARHFMEYYI